MQECKDWGYMLLLSNLIAIWLVIVSMKMFDYTSCRCGYKWHMS